MAVALSYCGEFFRYKHLLKWLLWAISAQSKTQKQCHVRGKYTCPLQFHWLPGYRGPSLPVLALGYNKQPGVCGGGGRKMHCFFFFDSEDASKLVSRSVALKKW